MLKRLLGLIYFFYHTLFTKDEYKKNIGKWFFISNKEYLTNYNLTDNSIVFDVGGYKGIFSDRIILKYNPYMYIFEPVKEYYNILQGKYKNNLKVKIYNVGLSDKSEKKYISVEGDSSSIFKESRQKEEVRLVDIVEFMNNTDIKSPINLMSINIEGGEYALLEQIINSGLINQINNLQIQFHDFFPDSHNKRKEIVNKLNKTHIAIFSYPFVWEGFRKR